EEEDKEEEKEEVAIVDEDEEFTCTECGAPVSASSNFCPNCGERFDGIEEGPAEEGEGEEEKPAEEEEKGAE
ncbi:MAG: zinc-ribbon domain-containing protein, partial [Thermoplasmata archaeon]|nr:zinc-ribbon domain-containing protein [Thermoplasmata archaeon]